MFPDKFVNQTFQVVHVHHPALLFTFFVSILKKTKQKMCNKRENDSNQHIFSFSHVSQTDKSHCIKQIQFLLSANILNVDQLKVLLYQ